MHDEAVSEVIATVLPTLQMGVTVGDYVKHCDGLGEVVGLASNSVILKKFLVMDSAVLQHYSLPPLDVLCHPLAAQDKMVEVYQTFDTVCIERSCITDVVFILPVKEVESGRFYLSGARNVFLIRFIIDQHRMMPWTDSFYFSRRVIETVSIRLFHALNALSDHIRRCLFHRPESQTTLQSFKLPLFPCEAFWYMISKVSDQCISIIISRNQRTTKYYSSLKMESVAKQSTFIYLRVLSKPALEALQNSLGTGIRLGLSVRRPTKNKPVGYCSINSSFTSIECLDIAPADIALNPRIKSLANGIDFVFSEENRILSGHVRFQKMVINNSTDITSRMPTAVVQSVQSSIYVDALFYYNDVLYEVQDIDMGNSLVRSSAIQDDVVDVILPIDIVQNLVSLFGK